MTYDSEKRISADEASNHPWLRICQTRKVDTIQTKEILHNLRDLNKKTKLQKAAMMFIVTQLMTKEERDKLTEVFVALDKNGDGKLTYEELENGYCSFFDNEVLADKELKDLFNGLSKDKNVKINYSEFLVAAANKKKLLTLENIKQAFAAFDVNNRGYISPEELKIVLGPGKRFDEKVWKKIVDEVDTKGIGKITYEMFEELLMNYII